MKLRLHENSLRLRLSQTEVKEFGELGYVRDRVEFVNGQMLSYEVEYADRNDFVALFENNGIRVILPAAAVKHWIVSDEPGIEGSCGPLRIIVEKDFQCLHRDAEQNADAFPNPLRD